MRQKNTVMKFTIKKARHFSRPFRLRFQRSITKLVRIDESWIYDETKQIFPGWNKLIGIADGFHQQHSNRIVWRCLEGKIAFGHLFYRHGNWAVCEFLPHRSVGDVLLVNVRNTKNSYVARVGGSFSSFNRTGWGLSYLLTPYFGGRETAPHDMIFEFFNV